MAVTTGSTAPLGADASVRELARLVADLRRHQDPGRLDRAVLLYLGDAVSPLGSDAWTVRSSDGTSSYVVTSTFCECPDHERGYTCKHRLATQIAAEQAAFARGYANVQARSDTSAYERLFPSVDPAERKLAGTCR